MCLSLLRVTFYGFGLLVAGGVRGWVPDAEEPLLDQSPSGAVSPLSESQEAHLLRGFLSSSSSSPSSISGNSGGVAANSVSGIQSVDGFASVASVSSLTNPCDPNPCKGTCVDLGSDFRCDCLDGYEHPGSDLKICEEINVCRDASDNPCVDLFDRYDVYSYPNPYTKACVHLGKGEYKCLCANGYQEIPGTLPGPDGEFCEDIDECAKNSLNICDPSIATCVNEPGSYRCDCFWGWKNSSPTTCVDIDECSEGVNADRNIPACAAWSALCVNSPGTYECECYTGYRQSGEIDKESGCHECCIDIDECAEETDSCSDFCEFGTLAQGATPVGTNYTCGCDDMRWLSHSLSCDDCLYTNWSLWTECSVTCGQGTSTRTRTVTGSGRAMPNCENFTSEESPCLMTPCSPDCVVSAWSVWSDCSVECGGGEQTRTRTILSEETPGDCSDQELTDVQVCNQEECSTTTASDVNWWPVGLAGGGVALFAGLGVFWWTRMRRTGSEETL